MEQSSAPECSEVSTTDSPPRRPARPRSCPRACRGAGSRSPSSWCGLCLVSVSPRYLGRVRAAVKTAGDWAARYYPPLSASQALTVPLVRRPPSRHLNIKFTSKTSEKRTAQARGFLGAEKGRTASGETGTSSLVADYAPDLARTRHTA